MRWRWRLAQNTPTGIEPLHTLVSLIEDESLKRNRGGFLEALHSHPMLTTGFLKRDRGVTGHLMLATGFVIRGRVVTEGETSTQAWKA